MLRVLLPHAVHRPRAPHGQQQVGVRALLQDGRREEEDEQRKGVMQLLFIYLLIYLFILYYIYIYYRCRHRRTRRRAKTAEGTAERRSLGRRRCTATPRSRDEYLFNERQD